MLQMQYHVVGNEIWQDGDLASLTSQFTLYLLSSQFDKRKKYL